MDCSMAANDSPANGRDAGAASRFAEALFGGAAEGHKYGLVTFDGGKCRTLWQAVGDWRAADTFAERTRAKGLNAYINTGLFGPQFACAPHKRGAAADVRAVAAITIDADLFKPGNSKPYPPEDAAREELANMPFPPSLLIASGGGLQPWWFFCEPWEFTDDRDREAAKRLIAGWQGLYRRRLEARGFTVDSTPDVSRMMRLPGTLNVNHGEPREVRIIEGGLDDCPRYDRNDFEQFIDAEPAKLTPANLSELQNGQTHGRVSPAEDDATVVRLAGKAKNGEKFKRLFSGDAAGYESASEADLALCNLLAFWVGRDTGRIDGLFRQSGLYRDKWDEQRGERTYGEETIRRAIASASDVFEWRQPDAAKAPKKLTDLGNAELFVKQHKDDARYCPAWKCWLVWNGKYWEADETGAAERLAKQTVRGIWGALDAIEDPDERAAAAKWARKSESVERIAALLKLAKTEPEIPIAIKELDARPWLLNVGNGTVDLRTGELRPHNREDLLTKFCAVNYSPTAEAECPLWENFLWTIMAERPRLVTFLKRLCGSALVGEVIEHVLPILYGVGANGKSVFVETLLHVLGEDYAMKAPPNLLMQKKNESHPTERADLFGKRIVVAVETEDGGRLAESLVKELTGSDTIRARRLYENHWQFMPSHQVLLVTNHKPQIRGTDNGIWRRVRLVPFDVVIPEEKQDKHLQSKLRREAERILRWLVQGCLDWQRDGLGEPEEVTEATGEYRAEQDIIAAFVDECCVSQAGARVKASELYKVYAEWATAAGEHPLSNRRFGQAVTERGFEKLRSNGMWYCGVGLRAEATERTEGYGTFIGETSPT